MRKYLHRACAIIAALLMVLVATTPAFAAGSITIADAGTGSYELYKIFDATESNGNVSYALSGSSAWKNVLINSDGSSKVEGLEFVASGSNYTVKKGIGFDAAAFAKFLKDNKGSITADKTAASANDVAAFSDLASGYYLVLSTTSGQDRGMLTTVLGNDEVTIQNKNDMPLDKTYKIGESGTPVKEGDAQIGDVLTFEVLGKVPNTTGYTSYVYLLSDTMDSGLTFSKTPFTVTIDGTAVTLEEVTNADTQLSGNQVRFGKNGKTFELSLDLLTLGQTAGKVGKDIKVTYTATLNENASSKVTENRAVLTYSDNPSDSTSFANKDTETEVYTSRIVVDKFENGAPERKLKGAKFVLKSGNKFYKYDSTNKKVTWVDSQSDATEVTTDSEGSAEFKGLKDGTYSLVETAAPAGYTPITSPISITVDGSAATTVGITQAQQAIALTNIANVANTPGTVLPGTGGMGTTVFYVASALVLAVIVKRFARSAQTA